MGKVSKKLRKDYEFIYKNIGKYTKDELRELIKQSPIFQKGYISIIPELEEIWLQEILFSILEIGIIEVEIRESDKKSKEELKKEIIKKEIIKMISLDEAEKLWKYL